MSRGAERLPTRAGAIVQLLALAAPVAGARLGVMAMSLTNTIVVGRFSSAELSYQALGWAPTGVLIVTANGLLSGVQVMTSRALGEGRPERAGAAFRRGIVYALWIGLAAAAALFFFAEDLLKLLGIAPHLAAGAGRVTRVLALSMPFYLVATATVSFLEGLGRPGPGLCAMWAANIVCLGLNLILTPGSFGFAAMGAVGAAWSTTAARMVLMVGLLAWVALMPDSRRLNVFQRPERNLAQETEQRRIGYGAGASYFMETAAFSGMNVVAGLLGGLSVAGWAVSNNVASIVFMIPMGLATATSVMVGRAYGARHRHEVVTAGWAGFILAAGASGAIALVVRLAVGPIVHVYAADPALFGMASGALALACLAFVPDAVQVVAGMALRARGDVWVPTVTHTLSYAVVMLPLAWVLSHGMGLGLNGIVMAVIVASLMSAGLLLGRFWMLARQEL
jgi:MATE family multidrug resistance protein